MFLTVIALKSFYALRLVQTMSALSGLQEYLPLKGEYLSYWLSFVCPQILRSTPAAPALFGIVTKARSFPYCLLRRADSIGEANPSFVWIDGGDFGLERNPFLHRPPRSNACQTTLRKCGRLKGINGTGGSYLRRVDLSYIIYSHLCRCSSP